MASWTSATRAAGTPGLLRPSETARLANLHRDYPVAPRLVPFVERYWSVRWDLTGRPAFRTEVLTHPCVNVSVESGTHPRFGFPMPVALVHGVTTRRFSLDLVGVGRVSAVKFRPGGFTAFTGSAPARDTVSRLTDVLGVQAAPLIAAVMAEDDDTARAAVFDDALAPIAPEPRRPYLELLELLDLMLADHTLVRVDQVAARSAMSSRSVQRLFASYVGVSPKAVLARYRLQDAAAAIDAGQVDDLAGLAASLGWFDQAHFSRDFRAVVGTTPSAYLQDARSRADLG